MNPQRIIHPLTNEDMIILQVPVNDSANNSHNHNRGFRITPVNSAGPSLKNSVCNTPINTSENLIHDVVEFSKKLREKGLIT